MNLIIVRDTIPYTTWEFEILYSVEQSNMDPQFAALLWKKHFHPLRKLGVRIGSPAVTSSEAGRAWLRRFLAACDGCEIDFLSVVSRAPQNQVVICTQRSLLALVWRISMSFPWIAYLTLLKFSGIGFADRAFLWLYLVHEWWIWSTAVDNRIRLHFIRHRARFSFHERDYQVFG